VEEDDIRLCIDLHWVNALTKKPQFRIPTGEDMFEWTRGSVIFTELDIGTAFYQLPTDDISAWILGFESPDGDHYISKRMPFGPSGAPTHYQMVGELAVKDIHDTTEVYLDNNLVHSKDVSLHKEHVCQLIKALTKAGLRIKLKKSKFGLRKIQFMGCLTDGSIHHIETHKVDQLLKKSRPKSGKQMESLLGFVNFLCDFIPRYGTITGPLEKLRKKNKITKAMWTEEVEQAWQALQLAVKEAPILHVPDYDLTFYLATDASQYAVGAVLYQVVNEEKHFICFFSKSLSAGQCNYPATKRELLAIVSAMQKWRHILYGRHFIVETDHKALTYLHTSDKFIILNWLDILLKFDFEVIYQQGSSHVMPDFLLRVSENQESVRAEEICIFKASELRVESASSSNFLRLLQEMIKTTGKVEPPEGKHEQLVQQAHEESHTGTQGTYMKLFHDGVFWPGMWSMAE
jgi:hypothetical protein